MSRDWTPEEIQRVSAALKSSGNMSFEEFCAELAKQHIERFGNRQRAGHYPCPRCGAGTMADDPIRNALSRRAKVYVCDACGTDEAIQAFTGNELPLTEWKVYQFPAKYDL